MLEPAQQRELSYSMALKVLAASAIGLTLGFGLCGAAVAANSTKALVPAALVIAGLSAIGLVVAVIWLIVSGIANILRKQR